MDGSNNACLPGLVLMVVALPLPLLAARMVRMGR
jgi:hypothetical protein